MRCTRMPFYGFIFSKLGLQADPGKVDAIKHVEAPQDVKSLQSFLGMVNYLKYFIPHVSDLTKTLHELLKTGNDLVWLKHHQFAFQRIKDTFVKI